MILATIANAVIYPRLCSASAGLVVSYRVGSGVSYPQDPEPEPDAGPWL